MKLLIKNGNLVFENEELVEVTLSKISTISGKYIDTNGKITEAASRSIDVFDVKDYVGRRLTVHVPKTVSSYGISLSLSSVMDTTYPTDIQCTGDTQEHTYNLTLSTGFRYLFVSYTTEAGSPSVLVNAGREQRIKCIPFLEGATRDLSVLNCTDGRILTNPNYLRSIDYYDISGFGTANVIIPKSASASSLSYAFVDDTTANKADVPSNPIMGDETKQVFSVNLNDITKKYLVLCYTTLKGKPAVTCSR